MRKAFLLVVLLLIPSCLFAIGFGYHVFDVRAEAEFSLGIFPASAYYSFDFPMPDFISGNGTLLSFSIDNGLEYRTLNQNPDNGEIFDQYPDHDIKNDSDSSTKYRDFTTRDYSTVFDEFDLAFEQGFFGKVGNDDVLDLHFSLGGRFELSVERLSWLRDQSSLEGVFWRKPGEPRFPGSPWVGAPELSGDRMTMQTFMTFGLRINGMEEDGYKREGIRLSAYFRYSPIWFPLNGGVSDFMILHATLDASSIILDIPQKREGLSWFTMIFGSEYVYRYIYGEKVPYYAMKTDMFNTWVPGAEHLIYNRTYLNIYGPQFYFSDLYLSVSAFHEFAYSFGKVLNNSVNDSINEIIGLVGFKAEFNAFNIARAYFEVGYVYNRAFTGGGEMIKARFGVSLGF